MMGHKIGYLSSRTTTGSFKGKKVFINEADMRMTVSMLGSTVEMNAFTKTITSRLGDPLYLSFRSDSAGHITTIIAEYSRDAVHYTADVMGSKKEGTLRLKPGERFVTDPSNGDIPFKPRSGLKIAGKMFEPQSLRLIDVVTEVQGKEKIRMGSREKPVYRMESKTPLLNSTIWVDEQGEMLKMATVMGMEVRKETRQQAQGLLTKQQVDLVSQVAVSSDRTIPEPRQVRSARFEMSGFSAPLKLSNNPIQQTQFAPAAKGTFKAIFDIRAIDPKDVPAVEIERIDRAQLAEYLKPSIYVQSDNPQFQELARQVVGEERIAAKAAQLISDWSHQQLKPDATIGTFRSASDILKSAKGVCRDYATLFASVARAAGIPTKICLGLVYMNGKFMYHAWVECWAGEWVAYEPTFGLPFDATHIKLAEGDLSNIFDITRDLGKFTVKVIRYK